MNETDEKLQAVGCRGTSADTACHVREELKIGREKAVSLGTQVPCWKKDKTASRIQPSCQDGTLFQ